MSIRIKSTGSIEMAYKLKFLIWLSYLIVEVVSCDQYCKPEYLKRFIIDEKYELCEGEDSYNYTGLIEFRSDQQCTLETIDFGTGALDDDTLTACLNNGQRTVTTLRTLARSVLPAGAYFEIQHLALGLNGVLEGKYILRRIILQRANYLKECSSILGSQAVPSKLVQMLISKKLDLNCLISPNGCWELFKKGCTTICNGHDYLVQSDANVLPNRANR